MRTKSLRARPADPGSLAAADEDASAVVWLTLMAMASASASTKASPALIDGFGMPYRFYNPAEMCVAPSSRRCNATAYFLDVDALFGLELVAPDSAAVTSAFAWRNRRSSKIRLLAFLRE